jgi:hypothetical protein
MQAQRVRDRREERGGWIKEVEAKMRLVKVKVKVKVKVRRRREEGKKLRTPIDRGQS